MIGGYMSFIKIRGKKFTLAEYLTEYEIAWLIKKNIIAKKIKMRTEFTGTGIKIRTVYIGRFRTNERKGKLSQTYFCQTKEGFYLSLDHGSPKIGFYGDYKKARNWIFFKRKEYVEGYKDVPGLEENSNHFINSDESDFEKDLWDLYYERTSL